MNDCSLADLYERKAFRLQRDPIMRLAYLDCFAGITGELVLGALIDAGLSMDALRSELAHLPLSGYEIEAQQVAVGGVSGMQVVLAPSAASAYAPPANVSSIGRDARPSPSPSPSSFSELVLASDLPAEVKRKSLAALSVLAAAGSLSPEHHDGQSYSPEQVRDFVLIVAAVSGLALLGVEKVVCSPLNVGGGIIVTGHSISPVPGPGVAGILQSAAVPIYGSEANRDLVSPVGAALAVALASSFGPVPPMPVSAVGYAMSGIPTMPSLRVILGDMQAEVARPIPARAPVAGNGLASELHAAESGFTLIEATLDDTNPQYYDFIIERLLWQGAQEVFFAPAYMKMNRPGVILSVVCEAGRADALCEMIFEEIGGESVRMRSVERLAVVRESAEVPTRWGPIKVRVGRTQDGRLLHVKPDYEDVKRIALEQNVPVERVYEEARLAWSPYSPDSHQQPGRQRFNHADFLSA